MILKLVEKITYIEITILKFSKNHNLELISHGMMHCQLHDDILKIRSIFNYKIPYPNQVI